MSFSSIVYNTPQYKTREATLNGSSLEYIYFFLCPHERERGPFATLYRAVLAMMLFKRHGCYSHRCSNVAYTYIYLYMYLAHSPIVSFRAHAAELRGYFARSPSLSSLLYTAPALWLMRSLSVCLSHPLEFVCAVALAISETRYVCGIREGCHHQIQCACAVCGKSGVCKMINSLIVTNGAAKALFLT